MTASPLIDCHAHIVDPGRFPFDDGPGYRPMPHETGTREAYTAVLDRHGVGHALLVQPSCYGFDNSALLDAMANCPGRFKAIAMVPADAKREQLSELARVGVIGVRFNLVSYDRDVFMRPGTMRLLQELAALDWFAEVVADTDQWLAIAPILLQSGVNILVDHFGMHKIAPGIGSAGFQAVLKLARTGRAIVKLSTPFSLSLSRDKHHDLDRFVELLLDAFGIERCVWGSDWPFLGMGDPPEYHEAVAFLPRWISDPADRHRILWDNPVRLFGFKDGNVA